jgi:hypothetical protein
MANLEKLDKTITELEENSNKLKKYTDVYKELEKLKEDLSKNLVNIEAVKDDLSKNLVNAKAVNKSLEGTFLLMSNDLKDFQKKLNDNFSKLSQNQEMLIEKINSIESQNKTFKKEIEVMKEKKKIVCSMMNESYGFGNYRNKIWLAQSQNLNPAYQIGYHKLFLPLVGYAKCNGITNKIVKRILEHIARHRTADIWKEKRGRRDLLGMFYRYIIEPICFFAGKF